MFIKNKGFISERPNIISRLDKGDSALISMSLPAIVLDKAKDSLNLIRECILGYSEKNPAILYGKGLPEEIKTVGDFWVILKILEIVYDNLFKIRMSEYEVRASDVEMEFLRWLFYYEMDSGKKDRKASGLVDILKSFSKHFQIKLMDRLDRMKA